MSRRARPQSTAEDVEWARADMSSSEGVRAAVAGVDAILHAASDPRRTEAVDVNGTRHLVEAARASRVAHIAYISIVGIDDIPLSYYKRKLTAEEIIKSSGVPHSILRATQFHSFVELFISLAARLPVLMPLPVDFRFQSVAQSEVAERLALCVSDGPRGRLPDFGGPEVLSMGEMAETWMEARGLRRRLIRLPVPGRIAAGFRTGKNTTSEALRGVIRWRDWLTQHKASRPESGLTSG
jgi:uncharacterized protein YbjT (DUF2867 family)